MRAYDNPAFVEDIVRDVVVALRADVRVGEALVTVTNPRASTPTARSRKCTGGEAMAEKGIVVVTSCTNTKVSLGLDELVPAELLYDGEQHRRPDAWSKCVPRGSPRCSARSEHRVGADMDWWTRMHRWGRIDATFSGVGSAEDGG